MKYMTVNAKDRTCRPVEFYFVSEIYRKIIIKNNIIYKIHTIHTYMQSVSTINILHQSQSITLNNFCEYHTEKYSKKAGFCSNKSKHCAYIIYRVKTRFFQTILYRNFTSNVPVHYLTSKVPIPYPGVVCHIYIYVNIRLSYKIYVYIMQKNIFYSYLNRMQQISEEDIKK